MAFSKRIYGDAVKVLTDNLPMAGKKVITKDLNDILDPVVDDVYYMAQGYLDTLKRHKVREKARGHGFGYIVVNAKGIDHPVANTILATG
ncbi:MAG: hypothetical protein IKU29_02320, partial [Parabacteroides sp.]|nr:hypothetical protein [Parabacteroides sp.]